MVSGPFTALGARLAAWHHAGMNGETQGTRLRGRLVDALYVEAMLLADEARSYFDEAGRAEREALGPALRVGFSCESLRVTTRLMHVIAWLLTQRAVRAGELGAREALDPSRRLGDAPAIDRATFEQLPPKARALIAASADLHRRVGRLDRAMEQADPIVSPALSMQRRLAMAF